MNNKLKAIIASIVATVVAVLTVYGFDEASTGAIATGLGAIIAQGYSIYMILKNNKP